jgi:hypothetical protein
MQKRTNIERLTQTVKTAESENTANAVSKDAGIVGRKNNR